MVLCITTRGRKFSLDGGRLCRGIHEKASRVFARGSTPSELPERSCVSPFIMVFWPKLAGSPDSIAKLWRTSPPGWHSRVRTAKSGQWPSCIVSNRTCWRPRKRRPNGHFHPHRTLPERLVWHSECQEV